MSISFTFTQLKSTASPLYKAEAADENGNVLMSWHIATDDESQLPTLAQESYTLAITPKTY